MLGNYSIYLGSQPLITFLIALLVLVPLGLFLCRYSLKFVIISIIGLAGITIYLSQSSTEVVRLLEDTGRNFTGVLFQAVFPVFFFVTAFGLVRYGLAIRTGSKKGRRDTETPSAIGVKNGADSKIADTRKSGERWKEFLRWFTVRDNIIVCVIAAAALSVHLINIYKPDVPGILDENFYIKEANNFMQFQAMTRLEHPPLGKWLITSGMFIFGDNPVGWRIFSIVFGMAAIFLFYFICKKLVAGWPGARSFVPVFATFLLATENLTFVLGQAAMLDVFYVTFMLLGFLLYLRGNYLSSGMVMGLSLLCKDTAVFAIAAIVIHWIITRYREFVPEVKESWSILRGKSTEPPQRNHILNMFGFLVMIPIVWSVLIVLLEYPVIHQYPLDTQWYNPVYRAQYMVWYHLMLTLSGAPDVASLTLRVPWLWLFTPSAINTNYLGLSPFRYLGSIGWTVWALIIPVIIFLIYEAIRYRKKGHDIALFLLSWLTGVYGLLLISQLLSDRVMYDYYFYPAVPAVCLGIAWGAWRLWEKARKKTGTKYAFITAMVIYVLGTLATFVIMSPFGTNLVKLSG